MPTPRKQVQPDDYSLDDPLYIERWMCKKCGLIFDYQFEAGDIGWPRFDPPLDQPDFWIDEQGDFHIVETDHNEFCPRCDVAFSEISPMAITIREVNSLSDFLQPGDGEGMSLEFKERFSTDQIRTTIAAFASTRGGKIILGVNNEGVQVGYQGEEKIDTPLGKDQLQQRIRGLISNIDPKPKIRIYFITNEDGLYFAVIVVMRGSSPLYSVSGKVYIRELDQTRGANTEEIVERAKRLK